MSKADQIEEFCDAHGAATVKSDVAAVSLPARLPSFYRQNPRLWFAQFETAIAGSKIGEDQKFSLVVPLLGYSDVEQIGDIIMNPPATGKYSTLKNRLISTYQESDHRQLQKLLAGLELGDQKPSQLLRKMRDLNGKLMSDEALKVMWLNQLPTQVRAVISVNTESTLEVLAAMADKMMEHFEPVSVAAVSTTTSSSCGSHHSASSITNLQVDLLSKQIEKLSVEIAELRSSQQQRTTRARPSRYPFRYRSSSRHRSISRQNYRGSSKPGDADWLCYYHYRFGDEARKCESPCSKSKSEN